MLRIYTYLVSSPACTGSPVTASRTNAWLSLPMLFFMGTSHGDYIILGK